MKIGECIYKVRKSNKLTQQQLGEKIGKSASAIKKYESGERNVTLDVILTISKVLSVDPIELFGDNKEMRYNYLAFVGDTAKSKEPLFAKVLAEKVSVDKTGIETALMAYDVLYEFLNGRSLLESNDNFEESFQRICRFIKLEEYLINKKI